MLQKHVLILWQAFHRSGEIARGRVNIQRVEGGPAERNGLLAKTLNLTTCFNAVQYERCGPAATAILYSIRDSHANLFSQDI